MKPIRTAIGIVLAIMLTWAGTSVPRGAAPEFPDEARSAMFGFLNAWLVQQDQTSAMAHFSASGDALAVAPRAVLKAPGDGRGVSPWTPRERKAPGKLHDGLSHQQQDAYWQVLNRLGVSYGEGPLEEVLAPVDPDLSAALDDELKVHVVHREPFTVFVAEEDVAIDSFDGGYGDVAAVLRPAENLVLAMIADFARRSHEDYAGPFVSFWRTDPDGVWRIHALGGAPEGEVWRDGRRSASVAAEGDRSAAAPPPAAGCGDAER